LCRPMAGRLPHFFSRCCSVCVGLRLTHVVFISVGFRNARGRWECIRSAPTGAERSDASDFSLNRAITAGMTTNFYVPPSAFRGQRVVLPEEEARHVCSVLRAEAGDAIAVVDGEGGWYRVRIDHAAPEQVVGTVEQERRDVGEPEVDVTVGMGMLTKRDRFETFVEKAVELGAARIVPLSTRHTERETVRADRLRRIMVAAVKQCRRSRLPTLAEPQSLDDLLAAAPAERRLLCHGGDGTPPLGSAMEEAAGDDVLLLVGPEGGFASEEVERARSAGCVPVRLGARRLRAETAGIAALTRVLL